MGRGEECRKVHAYFRGPRFLSEVYVRPWKEIDSDKR